MEYSKNKRTNTNIAYQKFDWSDIKMVNFINRIKIFWYLIKFTFKLNRATDNNARMFITQTRWRINQIDNENIKQPLLDFLNTMEKERFKNG